MRGEEVSGSGSACWSEGEGERRKCKWKRKKEEEEFLRDEKKRKNVSGLRTKNKINAAKKKMST